MTNVEDIEVKIRDLTQQLDGRIPFLAHRGDTFGRRPEETEGEHWLRRLRGWVLVKGYDPVLWEKMVRGD